MQSARPPPALPPAQDGPSEADEHQRVEHEGDDQEHLPEPGDERLVAPAAPEHRLLAVARRERQQRQRGASFVIPPSLVLLWRRPAEVERIAQGRRLAGAEALLSERVQIALF